MDSQILRDAISGNSAALTHLINKYKDIAFSIAIGIVKNREDAEDITQDSFLKVLENIHKFRSESKFSTWLYRIVYNQCIRLRHVAQRVDKHVAPENLSLTQIVHNEKPIADYNELYKAIDSLDDREKSLVQLFYLGEKTIKEIHKITSISISNIKVTLHRARKKLSENLEYETVR
jgi:RNA polymerase sigma-70 factor (ECF subfamily)